MVKVTKLARFEGQEILEAELQDETQNLRIMSYGAVTRDWRVSQNGRDIPIVLGFPEFADYPVHSRSFGIIAGRVANRTALGRFSLEGKAHQLSINNGPHHLHGGVGGFGRRNWEMEADSASNAVRLSYVSADGEEGYPGRLEVSVVVALFDGVVTFEMEAVSDRATPVNLAQHNYYNLNGQGDVLGHLLEIDAPKYMPVDETLIPVGDLLPVTGTRFDFVKERQVGERDPGRFGMDNNLVLREGRDLNAPVARVRSEESGLELAMTTDQPGLQLFNAPRMEIAVAGHDGAAYGNFAGLCLEPQHFPDYLNQPSWPQSFASPDAPYRQALKLSVTKG